MESKFQTRTEQVLTVMKIIAWIALFGFVAQAGAYVISYFVSIYQPIGAKNLYMGTDLLELKNHSVFKYSTLIAAWVALLILKANVWYRVARMISLMFVVSQIFRRGVEIQSENDLTV